MIHKSQKKKNFFDADFGYILSLMWTIIPMESNNGDSSFPPP